jgi:hypothetical protein
VPVPDEDIVPSPETVPLVNEDRVRTYGPVPVTALMVEPDAILVPVIAIPAPGTTVGDVNVILFLDVARPEVQVIGVVIVLFKTVKVLVAAEVMVNVPL